MVSSRICEMTRMAFLYAHYKRVLRPPRTIRVPNRILLYILYCVKKMKNQNATRVYKQYTLKYIYIKILKLLIKFYSGIRCEL